MKREQIEEEKKETMEETQTDRGLPVEGIGEETKWHFLPPACGCDSPPAAFTYPFHYTPHPLCVAAAEEVQAYLRAQTAWQEELQRGKMFGVLIVQTKEGEIGYVAAFSGILAGNNCHAFFVPPVYDLLQPDGFFTQEEEQITALTLRIQALSSDPAFLSLQHALKTTTAEAARCLAEAKIALKEAKALRDACRRSLTQNRSQPEEITEARLTRESQFMKAEYKRCERKWKERLHTLQTEVDAYQAEIEGLKTERKKRSAALQQRLFSQFVFLNGRGESKDLCAIFKQTVQKIPPAGAGECAAPKLLQYAYRQGWKPLAMAEFWWGDSPKTEIRRHGNYYPACQGKCGPILAYMLEGLEVEPNPLLQTSRPEIPLEILFEDEWLVVVNKPAGLASVPGKAVSGSLYERLQEQYPEATGPLLLHRLDMATSGVLLAAKTKAVHQHLQAQFKNRTIRKRYIALLDGRIPQGEGTIDLPLRPDLLDRPRQQVDPVQGKPALTAYRVLEQTGEYTRVAFFPATGRTHQLRVHAAHCCGLHAPIVGDELYGKKADRLYLHAEYLEFIHPVTGKRVGVEKKAPF